MRFSCVASAAHFLFLEVEKQMKKPAALLLALVMCLILCACSNSGINESQILSDVPEYFLTVDDQPLNYDSIEITKRNTEDGVDNIYFTLNASNDDYEATAQCHFQYNHYSEGGWILDCAEIVNGEYTVVPLNRCSNELAEEYMQENYTNYELISSDFGSDGDSYYTEYLYEGTAVWEFYSESESVDYIYIFETELESQEYSDNTCSYDISTNWADHSKSDILAENWTLELNLEIPCAYNDEDMVRLTTSPANNGSRSVKYNAKEFDADPFSNDQRTNLYTGEGDSEYSVSYLSFTSEKYVCFPIKLYWTSSDGNVNYNDSVANNYEVRIFKDRVVVIGSSSTYSTQT